jgi:hypothetical protein
LFPVPFLRRLAATFAAGAVIALACDALLQLLLIATRPGDVSAEAWLAGVRIGDRAIWIVAASVAWLASGIIAQGLGELVPWSGRPPLAAADALRLAGATFLVGPVLVVVATWVVFAVRLTLTAGWPYEGRILLEPSYYSGLVTTHAPTLMAGAILLALARHWPSDPV